MYRAVDGLVVAWAGASDLDADELRDVRLNAVPAYLDRIARALNSRGVKTARGRVWEATTVRNVLRRGNGAAVL